MTDEKNWRPIVTAADYLTNQKKTAAVADRRPVIRRASDLVGPGIAGQATRITDFDNVLATFNGFFSSAPGANKAPNPTGSFVGVVSCDSSLGGIQDFTELSSGVKYTRIFQRNPADASTIYFGEWRALANREPWTIATSITWATTGPGSALTTVTFPVGLFATAPGVHVTKRTGGAAKAIPYVQSGSVTTSQVQVGLYTGDGSNVTASTSVAVEVTAVHRPL